VNKLFGLVFWMVLLLGSLGCLAQPKREEMLESVTWVNEGCILTWVITEGVVAENGDYKPDSRKSYQIDLHKATMSVNGETRGFSKEEAARVHRMIVEALAQYAMESTVWWDQGHGEKLSERAKRAGGAQSRQIEARRK